MRFSEDQVKHIRNNFNNMSRSRKDQETKDFKSWEEANEHPNIRKLSNKE